MIDAERLLTETLRLSDSDGVCALVETKLVVPIESARV